jgi:hypothetical protein
MANMSRAMVSEEIVELRDGVWNVLVPPAIHDVEPLARVCDIAGTDTPPASVPARLPTVQVRRAV